MCLGFARNMVRSVSGMSDEVVHIVFKESCKMVHGVMVLLRFVWIGTLYKLLGHINPSGCSSSKTNGSSSCLIDETMLWNQRMIHIGEKGIQAMKIKSMVMVLEGKNCVRFPSSSRREK